MFDWLRNLLKTKDERHQERLTRYLDGSLPTAERQAFEQTLAQNPSLQADLQAQQQVKQILRQLPRQSAPRNFVLDPALYAKRQPSTAEQLYPKLRLATAVMAVLLVGVIVLDFGVPPANTPSAQMDAAAAPQVAQSAEVTNSEPAELAPYAAEAEMATMAEEQADMSTLADEPAPESETGLMAPAAMGGSEAAADSEAAAMAPQATASPTVGGQSPRPTPAPTLEARMAEPTAEPTQKIMPTSTPLPTAVPPLQTPTPEPPTAPTPLSGWRIAQVIVGLLTAVLLAATLLLRRRL